MWLSSGDKNSGYFHAVAKGRRARNRLSVMENAESIAFYEEEDIGKQVAEYYQAIFTSLMTPGMDLETWNTISSAITPSISAETNVTLASIREEQEIKSALFNIHPDKAPGPDGFSACFFQSNWEVIKTAFVTEIQRFFRSGLMPTTTNVTYVRLIPKITGAKLVSDYRPIALCNVFYKIITKIISIRLKPILGNIISESQSAFVPGRAISDNVLITHEILHSLKNLEAKIRCSMAVKTDMSKAYDRLEWNFIRLVLTRFGFSPVVVDWILQCVSTVSFSFLINNSVYGSVIPSRGIRQGDPLSPYIFILCGEVLSGLCAQAQRSGHLTGLQMGTGAPRINHLLFADDTIFFLGTDARSCSTLKEILRKYEAASGQMINTSKSSISFSAKTLQETRLRVKTYLGIAQEGGVGKYLGLPEHFGRRKKDLFTGIVDRISRRAAAWASKRLSIAGKLVMLKSVLTAIPSYSMTCFLLPVSLCKRIQSVLTRFWWDSSENKKGMCWVSWDRVTQPKDRGGLGIRDIQAFNVALLAKQAWHILTNPDCIFSRAIKGKYCRSSSFLQVTAAKTSSHGWRGILEGRDLLVSKLGVAIGNGEGTRIWREPWLSTTSPARTFGPPREEDQDLVVADLLCRGGNEWNVARVNQILPHLKDEILLLKPSVLGASDSYVWLGTANGEYSAKSGYYIAAISEWGNTQLQQTDRDGDIATWKSKLSPKVQLFMRKVIHGAVATGENLAARGLLSSNSCVFCGDFETAEHLFMHCPVVRRIWDSSLWTQEFDPANFANFGEAFKATERLTCLPPLGVLQYLFPWVCWSVWVARNNTIFENKPTTEREILSKAIAMAREWTQAQPQPSSTSASGTRTSHTTALGEVEATYFTDAAWNADTLRAGSGWLVMGTDNEVIFQGSTTETAVSSPLMAEALAMRTALLHAKSAGYSKICINSDCQALLAANSSSHQPAELYGINRDIGTLSSSFSSVMFKFISLSQNFHADGLAKSALYSNYSAPIA